LLIVIIAALLGIWRYRSKTYFTWVAITALWMFAGGFFFQAGGTLEDPTGDGLITRQIRIATQDGPGMGLFAIIFLVTYWGGVIYFVSRMAKAANAIRDFDPSVFDEDGVAGSNNGRKIGETVALLVASALWVWFAMIQPAVQRDEPQTAEVSNKVLPKPTGLTIEQELLGVAAEINSSAPQRIDEVTVLERATASGRELTYHYSIEADPKDREQLERFLRTNVLPKVCTGDQRPTMRDHGVSYIYRYEAGGFSEPVVIKIEEGTCAGLER